MSNVKALPGRTVTGDPVPEVVEQLERLLAEAKRGEIREIAFACVTDQKSVRTTWHHDNDYFRLVGAVAWLGKRLLDD